MKMGPGSAISCVFDRLKTHFLQCLYPFRSGRGRGLQNLVVTRIHVPQGQAIIARQLTAWV